MNQYAFWTTLLLDVVVKVALLLLIVWVGSLFIRKRSAAAQHRWWTLGFVGCLLIPVITLVTPTWTLPILPGPSETAAPSSPNEMPLVSNRTLVNRVPSGMIESTIPRELTPQPLQVLDNGMPKTSSEQPIAAAPASADKQIITSMANILFIVWIVGIAVCWLRSVWQHILLKRLLNDCFQLENPQWHELLSKCSELLEVKQEVALLRHPSALSPVSSGLLRQAVILPEDAENWDVDRTRLVLLHELAHVQRRDVLTQTLAGLACGLYWFNPLCWYGLSQMRRFRELACDDLVLSCEQRPSRYADVLLGIARSYRHQSYSTAVGMAHNTNVESRILAILDKTRLHVSLSRPAARLLLALAVVVVCLIGTAQLRSQAEPSVASADLRSDKTPNAKSKPSPRLSQHQLEVRQARVLTDQNEIKTAQRREENGLFKWPIKGKQAEWFRINLERKPLLTEKDVTGVTTLLLNEIARKRNGEKVTTNPSIMDLTPAAFEQLKKLDKPQADQRFVLLVNGQPIAVMATLSYSLTPMNYGGGWSLMIGKLNEEQADKLSDVVYQRVKQTVAQLEELAITIDGTEPTDEQLEEAGRLFDNLWSALRPEQAESPATHRLADPSDNNDNAIDKRITQYENVFRVENVLPRTRRLLYELYKRWATGQLPVAKAEKQTAPPSVTNDGYVITKGAMRIRVLDPTGNPFPNVKVNAKRKDYYTDANGIAEINFPERLSLLRVWVRKKGYVPLFIQWWPEQQADGHLIPEEYSVRLQKGTVIGGVVLNEQGQSIQNVKVEVRRIPSSEEEMLRPRFGTWLAYGGAALKTDEQGRWSLDNVPAGNDVDISVKLSHPKYSDDSSWGDLQRAQGITTEKLRNGDAKFVMPRGMHVKGEVVNSEGKPVTKGWVVWSDTPYFGQGVWEKELDDQGFFETPQLEPGEHPITIVAPGYAAQRRVVKVRPGINSLRFELKPGKRIEIHFVDKDGNPIPKVGVYLANTSFPNTWQGSNALHNHKHPNVPEYGISRRADDKGIFVWDWAPEEPVLYSVGAKGFAPQKISLLAKSEPHVITLADARVVFGSVSDAVTGEPVKDFQAMPVIVYRPNFFGTRYADMKQGDNGRYELPLTGSGDPDDRYRVRFEAYGYRSIVSEDSFGPLDGRVELNVQLEPAPARKGRVVDTDSNPVSGATVLEGTPTWVPSIYNSKPDSYGERVIRTDSEGRFQLKATTEPVRVRVLHDKGIVERLVDPAAESLGDVQLQPWAKVSGRLLQDGQPVGDQRIYFDRIVPRGLGEPRFQGNSQALTAADGTFSFPRLPPGAGSMRVELGPWRDSPLTSAKGLSVVLQPGESREIILGDEGAVLTGQVVATGRDEAPLDRNWSLNHLISRDRGAKLPNDFPALSFDPTDPMQPAWSLDPHFNYWVATRENHFVKLTPDGKLRVTGVQPGDYDLVLRLYEQPAGCLVETVGEKIVPVRVEGEGEINLGQIEVPCRAGPRAGSDMRAFEYVDVSGRKQSVSDLSGQYVLMHVWASWCGPCLESMPNIQHTAESLAGRSVTIVGLNVDKDSTRAAEQAERNGWSWSQNYLGDDSDIARQLAISSVPTYYLIGPDGLLAASATEWSEIKKELLSSLNESGQ